jgi:hypothetical protein
VGVEGTVEVSPRHLVVHGASGDVVGPPRAGIIMQLLRSEESLLHLHAVQEPKLGLDYTKPVVDLERLSCLSEEQQMSSREVVVCSWSWSGSISCPLPPRAELAMSYRNNSVCSLRDSRIEAMARAKVDGGGGFVPFT